MPFERVKKVQDLKKKGNEFSFFVLEIGFSLSLLAMCKHSVQCCSSQQS